MMGGWRLFLLALAWAFDTLAAIPLFWLGDRCARVSDWFERKARGGR